MNFNIILSFVLICFGFVVISGQKSCSLKELDLCGSSYLLQQNLLPTNDREMNRQCDQMKQIYKCFESYGNRCLSSIQLEFLTWMFRNPSQHDHCLDRHGSDARNRLYSKAVCLNGLKRDRDRCVQQSRDSIEHLIEVKYDSKVASGCCVYKKIEKCMESAVEKKCGLDYVEFYKTDVMPPTLYDFIETICTGYEDGSDKCIGLLPSKDWKPKPNVDGSKSITSRLLSLYFY